MTANAFHNIAQIEARLWEAADQLRANSNLTTSEYSIPKPVQQGGAQVRSLW
jgi:type I restriction enzyme M protein